MSRPLIVIAAFLALAVPVALAAPPADKGKPEKNKQEQSAAQSQAAKTCKGERGTTSASKAAFKVKYGSNGLGKCIAAEKAKADDGEDSEDDEKAEENAAKKCKKERDAGVEAFKKKYAPENHPNGANAFGKCVSKLAKAQSS